MTTHNNQPRTRIGRFAPKHHPDADVTLTPPDPTKRLGPITPDPSVKPWSRSDANDLIYTAVLNARISRNLPNGDWLDTVLTSEEIAARKELIEFVLDGERGISLRVEHAHVAAQFPYLLGFPAQQEGPGHWAIYVTGWSSWRASNAD
jgi:hypothetical protein